MPEGPRTIHIFMNFLQCYSLWRTLFELNHREYRVDLLNWHEYSRPTFKMPAPRLFCICFEHNDRIQTFLGRRTICLSSRMTCLSSRISGTVVREICPRWGFFPLVGYRQAYGPAVLRGFDIPTAEMDKPIWQTKLPPQLSDWCKLARCTNYQFSTIMWEKLTHPTTHSRTSQVAHRIVCSPMLMIGWTNHFCGQCQNVAHSEWQATKGALIDTRFQSICLLSRPLWGRRLPPKN